MSDIVKILNIQPPECLPDHSLLFGIFETSFFGKSSEKVISSGFNKKNIETTKTTSPRQKKKNLEKNAS